jgi:hypothetical protein
MKSSLLVDLLFNKLKGVHLFSPEVGDFAPLTP